MSAISWNRPRRSRAAPGAGARGLPRGGLRRRGLRGRGLRGPAARHLVDDLLGAVGDELGDLGRPLLDEVFDLVDAVLHARVVPEALRGVLELLVALATGAGAQHVADGEAGGEQDLASHDALLTLPDRGGSAAATPPA